MTRRSSLRVRRIAADRQLALAKAERMETIMAGEGPAALYGRRRARGRIKVPGQLACGVDSGVIQTAEDGEVLYSMVAGLRPLPDVVDDNATLRLSADATHKLVGVQHLNQVRRRRRGPSASEDVLDYEFVEAQLFKIRLWHLLKLAEGISLLP